MLAKLKTIALPAVVLAFVPATAYADAGTPLMWAGALHLLFGNAVIGVAEGLMLVFLFKRPPGRCVAVMIVANYFSAWVGGVFLISKISGALDLDLYNAWRWLWYMVAVSYVLTLFLEWPFVALCLLKNAGWFRKSIWGSLVVQSASYLVVFGWYWAASGTSLYTDLTIVPPSAVSLPKDATVYYETDGRVYARDAGSGETAKIDGSKAAAKRGQLYLRESRSAAGCWDLVVGAERPAEPPVPSPSDRIISSGVKCVVADPPRGGLRPGGDVPRFHADKSGWRFWFGWMAGRLDGYNENTGKGVRVSLETPFLTWPVYYPTQLPTGQVIFQLGENQICIFDPNEKKIALLAKGRSPVVTMKDSRR